MTKFLLLIATFILFAWCSDENKIKIHSQKTMDSVDYTNKQQGKIDSLVVSEHDSVILKTFEGPAMTPLGDAPKKQTKPKKHIKAKNNSTGS